MQRESYWLLWNRLRRFFRSDLVDWAQAAGVSISGKRLLDLDAIIDKFADDVKDLAEDQHAAETVRDSIIQINYEEVKRRLADTLSRETSGE